MKNYIYQGRNSKGQRIEGYVLADNELAAAEELMRQKITPLTIKLDRSKNVSHLLKSINIKEMLERGVPLSELILFLRQLFTLTKAGVSMLNAVQGLAENTGHPGLAKALQSVSHQLERGRTLSVGMVEHPKVFPRTVVAVVHVGESTGNLDKSLEQLVFYLENELETRKRIKQATRYPSFVIIALVVAMFILNIYVIPKFADMFSSMGVDLPLPTRIIIGTSDFFVTQWKWMILIMVALFVGINYALQNPHSRKVWDQYKIKIPIIGTVLERTLLGRFCRSFSVMLKSGVPLTQALNLVGESIENKFMEERIYQMRRGVERGESLLHVSRTSKLFSPLVLQMIRVGEETGSLDQLLLESAEYYEREVDYDLQNMLSKIEPLLIGGVALIVGVLAMGIFLPMWNMADVVGL